MTRYLTALLLSCVSGFAWAGGGELTLALEVTQLYVWRGLDLLDDTPALQPDLTWDSGNGWYLGAWGSAALDRGSDCREIGGDACWEWDEVDLYVGSYGELAASRRWETTWDLSFTYFNFPYQSRSADTMELALQFEHPRLFAEGGPTPYWGVYYNRGARQRQPDGFWVIAGLKTSIDLPGRGLQIDAGVTWKDGDAGLWSHTGFSNANLDLSTDFALGDWTLTPGLHFQKALAGHGPGIRPEDEVWVNLVFVRAF
jgi:uncharacterized protein (TIGR02001 family)